ncbi:MAG: ABC transporter ATP-binding protein, partial [Vagococcus sp.]|nr:ABC transporter ATP-binding protein [Vagococcus sp.]
MNRIETKDLSICYDDHLVVDSLNLSIPEGKITSIIGPNGCGKSTVLKTIGRIIKKQKGMVYLDGEDIAKISTKEIAKKMAILPQTPTAP